jgi:putative addiction module killer protein
MYTIEQTTIFADWIESLNDREARIRIDRRIARMALGNFGDVKAVGGGVSELRIDYGPGYRVYFCRRGKTLLVLLCGGDKRTQDKDIERAHELAQEV